MESASPEDKLRIQQLLALPASNEKVQNMLALYRQLGIEQHCKAAANAHTQTAIEALKALPVDAAKKEALQVFATALLSRTN